MDFSWRELLGWDIPLPKEPDKMTVYGQAFLCGRQEISGCPASRDQDNAFLLEQPSRGTEPGEGLWTAGEQKPSLPF